MLHMQKNLEKRNKKQCFHVLSYSTTCDPLKILIFHFIESIFLLLTLRSSMNHREILFKIYLVVELKLFKYDK